MRALTRDPTSEKARALAARGCEVVAANVDEPATLVNAFTGCQAAFLVTQFWCAAAKITCKPPVSESGAIVAISLIGRTCCAGAFDGCHAAFLVTQLWCAAVGCLVNSLGLVFLVAAIPRDHSDVA